MQLAHLAIESLGGAFDRVQLRRLFHASQPVDVARHDLQIVEPAEQVLQLFETPDQAKGRDPPELVDQLERVPELLGRDSHLVEPIEREQRSGIRNSRLNPIRPTSKPLPEQRDARRL